MKKTTQIFVLVLSLALLIGSVIGISVSASDTATYEIEAINVIYKDQIFVAIAVDAPVSDASDIEVGYTFNGKNYTASYQGDMAIWAEQGDDTLYPVFVTIGIPAKDMGEDVIAEAHVKGGAAGNTKNVSVASYLYQRLYKDGVIAETEGEELDKKNFYLKTLDYIAYAQKVLYNNANPDKTPRTLVTDYVAVYAQDATIAGSSFALSKGATEVTLTYTGAGTKAGWNVTTYDASGTATTTTKTKDTFSLTSSAVITPIVLDFEIGTPTIVETFEDSYKQNLLTFPDGSTIDCPTFGDYVKTSFPNTATYTNTTGESVAEVLKYTTEGGTSNALHMYSPGRINSDGSTNSNNRSHTAEFKLMESVVPADKVNAAVLEFDLKLGVTIPEGSCAKKVSNTPIQIVFRNYKGDGNQNSYYAYFQLEPTLDAANKVLTICGVNIPNIDEFVRVKLVADIEDKIIHIYANGELLGSGTPQTLSTGTNDPWTVFATYGILASTVGCFNSSGMADVYLDNVSFYNTYTLD